LSGWSGYVSSRLRTGFKSSICGCYPRVASQCMGTVTERNARRLPEPARGARRCTHWPHSRRVALADANVIFSAPAGAPALHDVSQTATMPEEPPPRQTQIPATSTHHPRPHQPPPATPATPTAGRRPPRRLTTWAPAALADTPPVRRQPRPRAGLRHATAPPPHRASPTHAQGDRPPESPTITDIACERYGLRPELSDSGVPNACYVVGNPSILTSG
jgi:hypothetical protein